MEKKDVTQNSAEQGQMPRRRSLYTHMHIALLVTAVLLVAAIAYRLYNWGEPVDLGELFKNGSDTVIDVLDHLVPLTDENMEVIPQEYGEGSTILVFGNAPFADDRGSRDNLANMLHETTGATVYNCSISGSYLTAEAAEPDAEEHPWDVFTFYQLCRLLTNHSDETGAEYLKALQILGDEAPAEAQEVYDTLTSIDLNSVDAVVVMYDASDYLAGRKMLNETGSTDPTHFTGNLEAGLEVLYYLAPPMRIIILSPAYAYGIDENGNYASSDIQTYSYGPLSTYSALLCKSCIYRKVTFIDNLYGTIHEDNAQNYLTDHLRLNAQGRQKIVERLVYALNFFRDSN